MELDDFLLRLAEVAPQFQWSVRGIYCIRGFRLSGGVALPDCCPITAITGGHPGGAMDKGRELGLDEQAVSTIITAADLGAKVIRHRYSDPGMRPRLLAVREKLLAAVGLSEISQ
jgi:hypothetical protein